MGGGKNMALILPGYCHGCEKFGQPFISSSGKIEAPKCDNCLQREREGKRARRLQELRIRAQSWESLAELLLDLEERIEKLEARRVF